MVRATRYVPIRRRGEPAEAAAARVHRQLLDATSYLVRGRGSRGGGGRTGEGEERALFALFDPTTAGLSLAAARAAIAAHYGPAVAFHRLVLSPHPSLELQAAVDLQRWTRDTVQSLERPLVWVGAIHGNTGIAHSHLLIAGACREGQPVELRPPIFALLRCAGVEAADRIMHAREERRHRLAAYLDGMLDL